MANKKDNKPLASQAKSKKTVREIKITQTIPDDVKLQYADSMAIKSLGEVFQLYFFQTQQPIILTPEILSKLKSVEQKAVASLVITPVTMANTIEALESNFANFLSNNGLEASNYKEFLALIKNNEKDGKIDSNG
ncbi:MAG: hypothetical protein M3405_14755 [Acidobacteriota bacterium]|jgi:hypothetical protein|nr:hypothetical protein [Acidobacteriota bacterium]